MFRPVIRQIPHTGVMPPVPSVTLMAITRSPRPAPPQAAVTAGEDSATATMIGKPKDQGARSIPVQHPLRRRLASGGQILDGPVLWSGHVRPRPTVYGGSWLRSG